MSIITLDFETYYDQDVGFAKQTNEEYINDPRFEPLILSLRAPSGQLHTYDICDMTRAQVKELLLDHRIFECAVLAQNTRFDGAILNWYYDVKPKAYLDTMLMARQCLRHRTGSTSLSVVAEFLGVGQKGTEVVDAKGKRRADFTPDEWAAYRAYCENDVTLTHLIFTILTSGFVPRELKVIDTTLRWYIEPKLELDMQLLRDAVLEEQMGMDRALRESGLTMDVLSSNQKFAAWLTAMGVQVPTKVSPRTGKAIPAIAKSDREFQALCEHENPTIASACKARAQAKSRIRETRMTRLVGIGERNNGKLPVPLLYSGAHTHRYAGDDAINLQNLTTGDALRGSIKAPAGYKLLSADQGQIEARINACLSDHQTLIEGFRNGEDVYLDMAMDIYGIPLVRPDNDGERKVGKAIVLGAGYGMGGERCYDFLTGQWGIKGIDQVFAQQCISAYRTKHWPIKENWKHVDSLLDVLVRGGEVQYGPVTFRREVVELPSGVKMYYPDIHHDGENYRYKRYDRRSRKWNWVKIYGAMMVENLCQALARELLVDQMLTLQKRWDSVHQIHDEIIFLVPEEETNLACQTMKKIMEISPDWMPNLPLLVDPSVGNNLGECK